jgi:demethylmenaquinone methyltransferase / 2-methoxy-6-polyprenyl-1,4-benzoquinol methylase
MFEEISPSYDLLNHTLSFGLDVQWRKFAARTLLSRNTHRVLDVCGGTGDMAMALSRRAWAIRLRTPIVSTDFAPAMVHRAHDKSKRALRPYHTATADTLCLPFRDSSFGLVTAAFGIRNVHDMPGALAEMARVCEPGGRIGILEFTMPRALPLRALYGVYFFHLLPRVGALISGTRAYEYLPHSVERFPSNAEFARILAQACGGEVRQYPLTMNTVCLHVAEVRK